MRNVAFSVMLVALALLQVAVISVELSGPSTHTTTAANREPRAQHVVAVAEAGRKTSVL